MSQLSKLSTIIQAGSSGHVIQYPYIIAEAGVNHEGDMDLAKRLIAEAAEGGAHAIKFQTYKAEKIASQNSPFYWDITKEPTRSQFELFKKYDKFWKSEYEKLKLICDEFNIEFLSTPFDIESATFLNDLMDVFKISSSDLNNLPFIDFMCQFGKPVLLSVGASYMWEVHHTVEFIRSRGNAVSLMHCILNYPTENKNANLGMIKDLQRHFPDLLIGYSDHTLPEEMETLKAATLLGAGVLEKHFTFDKTLPGNDHYHAMDKEDLKVFHAKLKYTFELLGSFEKTVLESEKVSRKNARRSLIAANDIKPGELFTMDNLTFKRPAFGISPEFIGDVLGKKATTTISKDDFITWDKVGS